MMRAVWPDTFVEEGNLTSNISILRKQLGVLPEGGEYIETIPKRGYRFVAVVTAVGDRDAIRRSDQSGGPAAPPVSENEVHRDDQVDLSGAIPAGGYAGRYSHLTALMFV